MKTLVSSMRAPRALAAALLATLALVLVVGCGGGGGGGGGNDGECDGSCTQVALSALDVEAVLAQAVGEAERLGLPATIAIVDRVGNVLAVFRMTGAATSTVITSGRNVEGGFENAVVPTELAAISKAGTAAYLSSQGNAFTTRTASQIVQENFNPGEHGRPGGPLFGVQFSQLPCGDLVTSFDAATPDDRTGPHRMPLGFSADAGGIPLYMESTGGSLEGRVPVGGIGVEVGCAALDTCIGCAVLARLCLLAEDALVAQCASQPEGLYTIDRKIDDVDTQREERIASAGAAGFEAPANRRANRIFVDGKSLRFADDERFGAPSVMACNALNGAFVAVPGYTDVAACGDLHDGVALGTAESGVQRVIFQGLQAEVLVDGSGVGRYPPAAGTSLSAAEVRSILARALEVAERTRAQIRQPLGTNARVSISVVDTTGAVLGIVRSVDAPVFGIDVSLQKARTAAFFSSPSARSSLETTNVAVAGYVAAAEDFFTEEARFDGGAIAPADVLTGKVAFTDRANGNLSRPFFPDGINGNGNGPFSLPFAQWSPFSTGLQLDLVQIGIIETSCQGNTRTSCGDVAQLPNGVQIFPGSVPIYRGTTLVGGLGVSGDGVDQDDLVAFLGLHQAGADLGGAFGNAPPEMRADNISVDGAHLRYVNCPVHPFLDSDDQGVCDGL